MKQHNCERCIYFNEDYYYVRNRSYRHRVVWVKDTKRMGGCMKRLKPVNKSGYPCEFYKLPPTWWQKLIRKWVR